MPINSINRVRSITLSLLSENSEIVPIYENPGLAVGDELLPSHTIVSFNCFIKNLKAFASVRSLPEAPLPNFNLEDSETDKLYKTLDIEWKSPRKQLNLYVSSGEDWHQVGSVSLLNPYGYPFRVYNLMDLFTDNLALELGDNSKIGIQVENVGYGLLKTADKVTIHGSYVEEIFVNFPSDAPVVNVFGTSGFTFDTPILDNNTLVDNNTPFGN